MTKARARERAKANAKKNAKKRLANAEQPGNNIRPGQFDPGTHTIKSPRSNVNANNFAGAKRGSARSS